MPLTADDGRPIRPGPGEPADDPFWMPIPPRDGDPVYGGDGAYLGVLRGEFGVSGQWWIDVPATKKPT